MSNRFFISTMNPNDMDWLANIWPYCHFWANAITDKAWFSEAGPWRSFSEHYSDINYKYAHVRIIMGLA